MKPMGRWFDFSAQVSKKAGVNAGFFIVCSQGPAASTTLRYP
jgi:hypothetical protein